MLKFESLKQFHAKYNKNLLAKSLSGLVFKIMMCLHKILGSNPDEWSLYVVQMRNIRTSTSWLMISKLFFYKIEKNKTTQIAY
jgi:hypothetical protein